MKKHSYIAVFDELSVTSCFLLLLSFVGVLDSFILFKITGEEEMCVVGIGFVFLYIFLMILTGLFIGLSGYRLNTTLKNCGKRKEN